ncbi:hypothetical protein [Nocardioides pakistanensis]
MSLLIGDEARRLVESFEADHGVASGRRDEVDLLDREFLIGRRLLPGTAALVVVLLGGFFLTVVATPGAGSALRWTAAVVGIVLVAGGGWLGLRVIRTGRRLLGAYLAWAAAGPGASPFTIPARLFSGPGILRSALAAVALLGAVFGWSFLFLGLAAGDPGGLGDGREAMAVLGTVSGLAFSVTTWSLFVGEIRSGLGHSGRVIRSRG